MTNCPTLSDLKQQKCILSWLWRPKVQNESYRANFKCQQGKFVPEAPGENAFLVPQPPVAAGIPCHVVPSLPLCSHLHVAFSSIIKYPSSSLLSVLLGWWLGTTWMVQDHLPRWRPIATTFTRSWFFHMKLISGIRMWISRGALFNLSRPGMGFFSVSKLFLLHHGWDCLSQNVLRPNPNYSGGTEETRVMFLRRKRIIL